MPISKVEEDAPRPPQGDTTAKPTPVPNESRRRVSAQDATAPASTAAQLTPERVGSANPAETVSELCSMSFLQLVAVIAMRTGTIRFQSRRVFVIQSSVASAAGERAAFCSCLT